MHDQCGIHAAGERYANGDVEYCRQCDGKSADGGVERDGSDIASDYRGGAGRKYDGDDGVGRDGVLRIGDQRSAGSDGDGAAGMRAFVGVDNVQGDTEYGDVDGWGNGSGVCDTDVLPGEYDGDGNGSANRRRKWRRDWMDAGFDGFRRGGMDVQAKPESGNDVCDIAAGGVRIGGLQQQFAAGSERGDAGGDLYVVVDDDIEWTDADIE